MRLMALRVGARPILLVIALAVSSLVYLSPLGSHVVKHKTFGALGRLRTAEDSGDGSNLGDQEDAMREWEYRRALQYEGSGARVQAFLDKARSGQPFTVSALGGSVSKGRGLTRPDQLSVFQRRSPPIPSIPEQRLQKRRDESPVPGEWSSSFPLDATTLYSPENLHVLIFEWLNETYPHPENVFVNGAQGGVGAGYFGWCFKEHIPDNSDLILMELGINDLLEIEVVDAYETVIRGILELESRPAVINIETFSTLFPTLLSSSSLHQDIAAFYDVPSLSVRDVILPRILADPNAQLPRWFRTGDTVVLGDDKVREWGGVPVDLMHISALGHSLAAGLVIRYLHEQIERSKPSSRSIVALGRFSPASIRKPSLRILGVPNAALTKPFDPLRGVIRHDPTCRSMNSGILHLPYSSSPQPDSPDIGVAGLVLAEGSHGWNPWHWKEKSYLITDEIGALASFDFVLQPPEVEVVDPPLPEVAMEEEPAPEPEIGRNRFKPIPLGMRPEGPYNINPVGVTDKRVYLGNVRRQDGEESEAEQEIEVTRERGEDGRVMIGYQRSATLGLGSVWCWVDDDREGGRMIEGYWAMRQRNMGMVTEVTSGLSPGPHRLYCELVDHTLDPLGRTEFRIFAVMHD